MTERMYFQIVKVASRKENRSFVDASHENRHASAQSVKAITSSLKKWQIYDKQTALSFFYSEIEKCWLVTVVSGSCEINNRLVFSRTEHGSESCVVIENNARISINEHSFIFVNLAQDPIQDTQQCNQGISNTLVHTLLKTKDNVLNIENALRIISRNCQYYKDFYFVLDAIRKNKMFDYQCGMVRLNVPELYNIIANGHVPVVNSIVYEYENGLSRDKTKSFNASKIWSATEFLPTDPETRNLTMDWPNLDYLQSLLKTEGDQKKEVSNESEIESCTSRSSCQSNKTSGRYINPYKMKSSGEHEKHWIDKSPIKKPESKTYKQPERDRVSTECNNPLLEKRKVDLNTAKRQKYQFDIDMNPTIEDLVFPDDSETSTAHSDGLIKEKKIVRDKKRSASCVEDGFLCEMCAELSCEPKSKFTEQYQDIKQRNVYSSKMREYKIKNHGFMIMPLKRYEVYKIKRY